MDRELRSRALRVRWVPTVWRGDWARFLQQADREPAFEPAPLSAAVWEAVWREDVRVGSREVGVVSGWSPNPYLSGLPFSERAEWVETLRRVSPDASELVSVAIRAEGTEEWSDAEVLSRRISRDAFALAESLDYARAPTEFSDFEREPQFGFGRGLQRQRSDDLASEQSAVARQQAATRLLLVGDAQATRRLLPTMLAYLQVVSGELATRHAAIEAFERLDPREIGEVSIAAARALRSSWATPLDEYPRADRVSAASTVIRVAALMSLARPVVRARARILRRVSRGDT
jgi:hypothetical protein